MSLSLCCSSSQAQTGTIKVQIDRRRHRSLGEPLFWVSQQAAMPEGPCGSVDEWLSLHGDIPLFLGASEDAGGGFPCQPLCFVSIDPPELSPCHCCPYIVSLCSPPLSFPRGFLSLAPSLTAEQIPFHGTIAPRPPAPAVQNPPPLLLWNDNHRPSGVESP